MSAVPRVTIFIPVYNRARYVSDAIESVLAQTFTDFELLLVDDGSTDASVEVMRRYTDPRIRLVRNGANLGIPRTRNEGLRLARGAYIALLDSDDRALPTRLARQVAFLDKHPDHALVGSWTDTIDEEGHVLGRVRRMPVAAEDVHARMLFRCPLLQYSVTARTSVLRAHGYRESFPVSQDYDLFARVAGTHRLANLPEVLVQRRVHAERVTRQRQELVKDRNIAVIAAQLEQLGVAFDTTDLERHFLLTRFRKLGIKPDRAYLDWADAWLRGLLVANTRAGVYSGPALARAAGELWLSACLRAGGGTAWARFGRSPLCRLAFTNVARIGLLTARRAVTHSARSSKRPAPAAPR